MYVSFVVVLHLALDHHHAYQKLFSLQIDCLSIKIIIDYRQKVNYRHAVAMLKKLQFFNNKNCATIAHLIVSHKERGGVNNMRFAGLPAWRRKATLLSPLFFVQCDFYLFLVTLSFILYKNYSVLNLCF